MIDCYKCSVCKLIHINVFKEECLRVYDMDFDLGEGWTVQPAGGTTGEAYVAHQGEQSVFLKRNSSPFLAVLSAEGIVPKLLWTKRLGNGDVITAQHWVEGRKLKSHEMTQSRVASLLAKIHGSSELLYMFKRIVDEPFTPKVIVNHLRNKLDILNLNIQIINKGMDYLSNRLREVEYPHVVVCHCDTNHNNWIVDEKNQLYLVDWDGAKVADPALDLALILYSYVPKLQRQDLLRHYGLSFGDYLQERMHWYMISQTISIFLWHYGRKQYVEAEKLLGDIHELLIDW